MEVTVETQTQPLSPWLTIWVRPRRTIRRIVDSDPQHQVILLAVLDGIILVLGQALSKHLGDTLSLPVIFLICAVAGPIVGIALLYVVGALMHWIGGRFGGRGSLAEIRAAFAWASVPSVWSQILWIPQFIIFGKDLFTSATPRIATNLFVTLGLIGLLGVQLAIAPWAFVMFLICLSEVHRFSIWKALATTVVCILVLFVPIFCVQLLLSGLTITP
jgi:hypothetical protein